MPLTKEVGGFTGNHVSHRRYYLADVEAIVGPATVVPDLGGPTNVYFELSSRKSWPDQFKNWLESPHEEEPISDAEGESSDDQSNYVCDTESDTSSDEGSVEEDQIPSNVT